MEAQGCHMKERGRVRASARRAPPAFPKASAHLCWTSPILRPLTAEGHADSHRPSTLHRASVWGGVEAPERPRDDSRQSRARVLILPTPGPSLLKAWADRHNRKTYPPIHAHHAVARCALFPYYTQEVCVSGHSCLQDACSNASIEDGPRTQNGFTHSNTVDWLRGTALDGWDEGQHRGGKRISEEVFDTPTSRV